MLLIKERLNLAIIGCGKRGQEYLENCLKRNDINIKAIADPDDDMNARSKAIIEKYNVKNVTFYNQGSNDYLKLFQNESLDAVIICSPWEDHISQALSAIDFGIIPGLEVCGANNLEECWKIVHKSEEKNIPVMILENVCFRRDIMAIFNMVKQGLFGELLLCHGGFQHDLRRLKFNNGKDRYGLSTQSGEHIFGETKWRTKYNQDRNGDLYPTHGFGPLANLLDINKGNCLISIASFATKSRGLHKYIVESPYGGPNCANANVEFKLGDIITSVFQTSNGETIVLTFDTNNPRPNNFGFRVQGTEGLWHDLADGEEENGLIYLEKFASKKNKWDNSESMLSQYEHPLWKKYHKETTEVVGYGGMDFFVLHTFIESIKHNLPFPFDVYDLATWYAITPLSEKSIAEGGQVQPFPDFTNGAWKNRKNNFTFDNF
ncbi:MAG: Gfo/Idh/MocA family oxidoreductase [Sediminibacterium sp.]|nr:Gfo/Idh/MocA family oxidoreductase [Sediminibacterium sp.]